MEVVTIHVESPRNGGEPPTRSIVVRDSGSRRLALGQMRSGMNSHLSLWVTLQYLSNDRKAQRHHLFLWHELNQLCWEDGYS